jgi:von Willebrand factor
MKFNYSFTVQQLQNSNRKMSFTVSKNGDNLLFVSHAHGIWLTFDTFGDVKLGISSQYANKVDGLCGFYSHDKGDDKRTPAGQLAASTVEFGDSWSVGQMTDSCEPHVCPKALQDVAWAMCNVAKDESFKACHSAVDPTHFISKCLETACDCLLTASNGSTSAVDKFAKQCKCSVLKNYVVECMAADENVHLETWRSVHSCEASCAAPFVHHDCFRRKCETTCNNLQSSECTTVPGTCFSGCYCPSGTVRKDSTCIPISECRDCVCDGFGKSQYLTYDRKNFTFDGNCTYLLTRDVALKGVHTFQVYATIGPCDVKGVKGGKTVKTATCTQAFHMVYGDHIVHIQKSATGTLEIILDGLKLKTLPHSVNWIRITEQGKTLNILLPESQVELVSMFDSMTFSVSCSANKVLIAVFDALFLWLFPHRRSKCRASSTAARWREFAEIVTETPTTIS